MKVFFYYVRTPDAPQNRPVATVAFEVNDDGTVNRGVAICSDSDNFSRKKGRAIAIGRLRNVGDHQDFLPVIDYDWKGRVRSPNFAVRYCGIMYKQSDYAVPVNDIEKRIVKRVLEERKQGEQRQ